MSFELLEDINVAKVVTYIYGKAGSGKSVIASQLAMQYKMLNGKNNVFYMCSTDISCDQNFSKLDFVRALDIDKIYSFDMSQDEEREMIKSLLSNSLIIFDDWYMAKNKKLITALLFKLIEVGCKFACSIIIIMHSKTVYKKFMEDYEKQRSASSMEGVISKMAEPAPTSQILDLALTIS
jgi:archaellum biogenesis ATPase FlaH